MLTLSPRIPFLSRFLYNCLETIYAEISIVMEGREVKVLTARLARAEKKLEGLKSLEIEINSIKLELAKFASVQTLPIVSPVKFTSTKRTTDALDGFFANCDTKRVKKEFQEENGFVVVYTDGACENNGKKGAKAGIGVWFGDNHPCNSSKPVIGRATNNTAEIQACIEAINIALQNDITRLKIMTDSQFVINSITKWIGNWKRNNWKVATGGDVKNKEDFQKLDVLRNKLTVKWEYVKAHVGIKGNEAADRLARDGAVSYVNKLH